MRTIRGMLATIVISGITATAGCSSTPPAPRSEGGTGTALTVVGWSLRTQEPIPIRGVLRGDSDGPIHFDTKDAPGGKTFDNIAPGRWRVEVTNRFVADRSIAAAGMERCDVRAGERVRCEVVVDDREGDGAPTIENARAE